MQKFEIGIVLDNVAFDGNAGPEVARILRAIASKIETDDYATHFWTGTERDINGNKVAHHVYSEDK